MLYISLCIHEFTSLFSRTLESCGLILAMQVAKVKE